jgi:hypothetical protein
MIPKECEEQFQIELKRYRATQSDKSWNLMWMMVSDCCSNIAKSKLKGIICPDFEGKVTDATIKCMQKIMEGDNPLKLSSFCYWPVVGVIYDRKLQKEERTISYEAWQEYTYAEENK